MADRLLVFYPQMRNKDGCFDSICLACFATIATAKTQSELFEDNQKHVCDPSTISQRAFDNRVMEKMKTNLQL
jgi:hypothetical protein